MEAGNIQQFEHHVSVVSGVVDTLELEKLQRPLAEIAADQLQVAEGFSIGGERRWRWYEFLVFRALDELDHIILKTAAVRVEEFGYVTPVPGERGLAHYLREIEVFDVLAIIQNFNDAVGRFVLEERCQQERAGEVVDRELPSE